MGLEHIEFTMILERTYDIEISDAEAATLVTVGNAFDLVASKLTAKGAEYNEDSLWNEILHHVSREGDYRPKKGRTPLTRETKLIDDLGWG